MRRLPILLALLTGACGRLAHLEPEARPQDTQVDTVLDLTADCSPWAVRQGTGFMISENRAITAAHVVACPDIPRVMAYDKQGHQFAMEVFEDRAMFGDGTDVARLELIGAYDRFEHRVVPPAVANPQVGDTVCAVFFGGSIACGEYIGRQSGLGVAQFRNIRGDSGAPVYDAGVLVGEIHGSALDADGVDYTTFELAKDSWLQGT